MTSTSMLTDRSGFPLALYLDDRAVLGPDDADAGEPVDGLAALDHEQATPRDRDFESDALDVGSDPWGLVGGAR